MLRKLLVLSLVGIFLFPTTATGANESFSLKDIGKPGEAVFTIIEPDAGTVETSVSTLAVQPSAVTGDGQRGVWSNCVSIHDPACEPSTGAGSKPGEMGVVGRAVLDLCRSKEQENCIESLQISTDGKNFTNAYFLRNLQSNMTIPADLALGHPGGSTALIWDDSNIDPTSKTKYLVSSSYGLGLFPGRAKFDINNIAFSITPFLEVKGKFLGPTIDPALPASNRISWGSDGRYFLNENGSAGIQVDFDPNKSFRLKVRVLNSIGGWFRGRLKDPAISVEPFSASNNLVTLQGEPVEVPTMAYVKPKSELNAQENQWWQNNGQKGLTTPQSSNEGDVFAYVDYFRSKVNDKAIGSNTYWTIQSVTSDSNNKCLSDKSQVIGIVTTNSMGYEGGSPSFQDGSLNYKVTGMHYMSNGTSLVTGTYDLVMRSEVARCLYGFSSAPISATISITGSEQNLVATTIVSEKDGWLKLAAYGFNFSNPVIKVKVSQAAPTHSPSPSATPSPTPGVTPVIAKKTSITCIKGKATKTVTAVKPVCPAGYKKK